MFLVSSCICLCPIHWSQVLRQEWRCSWSSADRQCSNNIWGINNFIAYQVATYIRGFMVCIIFLQKHYLVISLLTMCHFVFHVPSVSEFNIQVYFASWRTWIRYVKHVTERYSPLTSMCNAKTANVSIIPHVWDLTKIHVMSLPHGIALIVFKQYFHSIILMKMKISLVQ